MKNHVTLENKRNLAKNPKHGTNLNEPTDDGYTHE